MDNKYDKIILNLTNISIFISYVITCVYLPKILDDLFNVHYFNNGLVMIVLFAIFGILYFLAYEIIEKRNQEYKEKK